MSSKPSSRRAPVAMLHFVSGVSSLIFAAGSSLLDEAPPAALDAALAAGDECRLDTGGQRCALAAMQLKVRRAPAREAIDGAAALGRSLQPEAGDDAEACARCLGSCIPGEDTAFRGSLPYEDCVAGCSSCAPLADEDFLASDLYADAWHQAVRGPEQEMWVQWLRRVDRFRRQVLANTSLGVGLSKYASQSFQRSSAAYATVQTMAHDRDLYDPVRHVWTAEKYLDGLRRRFGGVDQVLIWPGYPNIGADSRSNLDMLEAMPGGLAAAVEALKAAQPSLLVQITYKPWDISTNGLGQRDPQRYAELVARSGIDGLNMDTLSSLGTWGGLLMPMTPFAEAAARAGLPDLIIEPELGLFGGVYLLNITSQGWLYTLAGCENGRCMSNSPFVPKLSLQKLLARGSMPHVCGRWSRQRSQEILTAYFNGVGFTAWENIWGIWNGINDFDAELLRRVTAILRHFHPLLSDEEAAWLPFYPVLGGVPPGRQAFASKFVGRDRELWQLVNTATEGGDIELPVRGGQEQEFHDAYHGSRLEPEATSLCVAEACVPGLSVTTTLRLHVEARGIGAVLSVRPGGLSHEDAAFLSSMRELSSRRLASFSAERSPVPLQQLVLPESTAGKAAMDRRNMALVRGSGAFEFRVFGTEIEDASFEPRSYGVDVQYPWEAAPTKYHAAKNLSIGDLWVDRHPVTNQDFAAFLREAAYTPADVGSFLRHWSGASGSGCRGPQDCRMPAGIARQPVVFVGLEDARAFCAHAGKRLPREWEWQYVAQAGDPARLYPWGNEWRTELMPPAQPDASAAAMGDVGQFPGGATRNGIEDLVGLIWHWTDEYADVHTRAAVLRGGSAFQPQHSEDPRYQPWYFPGQAAAGTWEHWPGQMYFGPKNYSSLYRLTSHGKYLLMAPSLDRAGTIGFRCVADASPGSS